jgi:hypothetical protein
MPPLRFVYRLLPLLLFVTPFTLRAQRQASPQTQTRAASDWRAVQNIQRGSVISVKAPGLRHARCYFDYADEQALYCVRVQHGSLRLHPPGITVPRRDAQEVRLEHSEAANAAAGAAIGAGAGAAIGAGTGDRTLTRPGGALLLGGIGAIIGGFAGHDLSILPGKIVYKR